MRLSEDEVAELETTNLIAIIFTSSEIQDLASRTRPGVLHNSRSLLNSCHGYTYQWIMCTCLSKKQKFNNVYNSVEYMYIDIKLYIGS